jgi:uncharacterized SAM-binding protein YcdF (DUF218 family)
MRYTELLLPLMLIVAAFSLFRIWRHSKERPWLLSLSIVGVVIISSPALAALFSKPLESRYDGRPFVDTGEAIAVLGAACAAPDPSQPFPPLSADSYSRSFYASVLYGSRPSRPVLVTGSECAAPMAHLLEVEGVPHSVILQEDHATNTHENALYSSKILRSKGIHTVTVVTDAKSMLRAELCFRKEGMAVVPYPVGLGTWKFDIFAVIPSWQAIRSNGNTFHEIVGLFVYWLRGWI